MAGVGDPGREEQTVWRGVILETSRKIYPLCEKITSMISVSYGLSESAKYYIFFIKIDA